jgi:alcohol dehydrogenase
MRAALYESFGGVIEILDAPDPSPCTGGVVLEIAATGICRSDWHAWVGHDSTISLPHVPGHEMAGTVVAIADDVKGFAVGDRVTVPFVLGCSECTECLSGNQQICDKQYQPGFSGWGAFAEFVELPYAASNLVRLPDSVSFLAAAGLGCRFATAYRAIVDKGSVRSGTTVVVWGCGGVGLSAVMIAAAIGATVVAVDIDPRALQLASGFGAAHTILSESGSSSVEEVMDLLGRGADVSVDALGSTDTARASIRSLRKRGMHIQVGLMVGESANPAIPMWQLHGKEIEMHGVHGLPAWQYPAMLEMIGSGLVSPGALVTETVNLEQGARHLTSMDSFPGNGFVVVNSFAPGRNP